MEAVKTWYRFGAFYRLGSEEERGSMEIETAAGEVLFKVFSYGMAVDRPTTLGEEGESMTIQFLSSSIGGRPAWRHIEGVALGGSSGSSDWRRKMKIRRAGPSWSGP
jgi:hypothetical protein